MPARPGAGAGAARDRLARAAALGSLRSWGALALWATLDRIFMPGARWFLRRRLNRMIDEVNTRLELQIPAFQQTRRRVLIDQLSYDPQVMEAIDAEAQATGTPREVLSRQVERYAREIVPSFNAYAYFRIGYHIARRAVESLYRVRLGYADDEALARIEPGASVVFVMNHRSNMDYVIVAYMAAHRSALSYAVGEWARVWPLRMLVRSLGAYFVRRGSGSRLYRQVLACYVQAATAGGVVQAVYPEGGLSRDGRLRKPKLGLINYMVSSFDPAGTRDLVFVPVGINYDRVLEDRMLVRAPAQGQPRRSRGRVLATALGFAAHNVSLMIRGRWYRFGYACVNFGTPLSMRDYAKTQVVDFRALGQKERFEAVERLGGELLEAIAAAIPVLPVSLVADGVRPLRRGARPAGDQGPDPGADRPAGTRRRLCPHPAGGPRLCRHGGPAHADAAPLRDRSGRALPRQRRRARHAALLRQRHRAFFARRAGRLSGIQSAPADSRCRRGRISRCPRRRRGYCQQP